MANDFLMNPGLDLEQGQSEQDISFFTHREGEESDEVDINLFNNGTPPSKRKAFKYALAEQHVNKDVLPTRLVEDTTPLSEKVSTIMAKLEAGDEDGLRMYFNEHHDQFQTLQFLKEFPMEAAKLGSVLDRLPPMDYAVEEYAVMELSDMKFQADDEGTLFLGEVEDSYPEIMDSVRERSVKDLKILDMIERLEKEAGAVGAVPSAVNWASILLMFNQTHRQTGERTPKAQAGRAMLDLREKWYGADLASGEFDRMLLEWEDFVKTEGLMFGNNPQLNSLALETLYNMSDSEADFETGFNILDLATVIAPVVGAGRKMATSSVQRARVRKNTIDTIRQTVSNLEVLQPINRPLATETAADALYKGYANEFVELVDAVDHNLPSSMQNIQQTRVGLTSDINKTLNAQKYALDRLMVENNAANRLDAEQAQSLFTEWKTSYLNRYEASSPADVRYLGRDEKTGLTKAEVIFGKPRGTGGYKSERSAIRGAERRKLNNYDVFQNDDGTWFIRQEWALADQRKQPLINLDEMKISNPVGNVLNPLAFTDNITRTRQIAASGRRDQMRKTLTDEVFTTLAKIAKEERQNVSEILAIGRQTDNDYGGGIIKKGKWFNEQELDLQFKKQFNRLPTESEKLAYYSYKNLSDFDYDIRNTDMYTKLASNGYQNITVADFFEGNGKLLSDWKAVGQRHYIYNADTGEMYKAGSLNDELVAQLENEGYELFETTETIKGAGRDGKLPVNHVITKSATQGPLKHQQLGYVEGGHIVYPDNNKFVKQANVGFTEDGTPWLGNPITHITGRNPKEVQAWAEKWERTRLAIKNEEPFDVISDALDDIGLDSIEDWNRLVEDGRISMETPFEVVDNGKQPSYLPKSSGYLDMRSTEDVLDDNTRYLVKQSRHKTFTGKRGDDLLMGPDELAAEILDPWTTMDRAINNAIRVNAYEPYRMQEVQRWVDTARANGVIDNPLDEDIMSVFNNPRFNTKRQGSEELVNKLALLKNNIRRQLGYQTEFDKTVEVGVDKLSQYVGRATKSGKVEANLHDFLDSVRRNGPEEMRRVASAMYLGMFNLRALWVQTQTHLTHWAISPEYAPQSLASYPMMRLYANASSDVLNNLSKQEKNFIKMSTKMEPQEFSLMIKELQRSGLAAIDHGYTLLGDIAPSTNEVASKYAKLMRTGNALLVETEKFNTLNAWNIAWREYGDNFKGLAKDTPEARAWISDRASSLIMDMRSSAKSMMQKELSIPMQFFQYPVHLTQNMLGALTGGGRFSREESRRLVLGQVLLYGGGGLPLGSAAVDYFDEVYFDITGEPMSKETYTVLSSGLLDTLMAEAFDMDTDISSAAGSDLYKQMSQLFTEKSLLEGLSGAAVPAATGLTGGVLEVFKFMSSAISENSLTKEDIRATLMDMGREISSINNMERAWRIYQTGVDISKTGKLQGMEGETLDALAALLNLPMQDREQGWRAMKMLQSREQRISEAYKEIDGILNRAEAEDTEEGYAVAAKRMNVWLSGLDPVEQFEVRKRISNRDNVPLFDKIAMRAAQKGANNPVTVRKLGEK